MAFIRNIFILLLTFIYLTGNGQDINVAEGAFAIQSSVTSNGTADRAVDGNTDGQWGGGSVTHTEAELSPWWNCDIGYVAEVNSFSIWNRLDCCVDRLSNFYVFASEKPFSSISVDDLLADPDVTSRFHPSFPFPSSDINFQTSARYFRVQLDNDVETPLSIAEFQVWAVDNGKDQQSIEFAEIPRKRTTDDNFMLMATSSAGLPVSFEVISGPATLMGDELSLTGEAGFVTVRAFQSGDDNTNPAPPRERTFEVVDPATVGLTARIVSLSEDYPLAMPNLTPYQLKGSASIEEADLFEITEAYFEINGFQRETTLEKGLYTCWWRPFDYGNHEIKFVALGSNGQARVHEMIMEVVPFAESLTITTLENDLISFPNANRTFQGTYQLPMQIGSYESLVANLVITCPAGGCDPWDRVAWVQARHPGGEWTEIIRYITPFGVACSHTIDLTEYMSVLTGEVEIRMFIDTWAQGWNATLRLTYFPGFPQYRYSNVDVLWHQAYDFGNYANLQPIDTVDYQFHEDIEEAEMRILISGHGWGENNTDNAAEFRYTQNNLRVGETDMWHEVWNNCNPNPDLCQPQNGTWAFDRSGWCPGAVTRPLVFDLDDYISQSSIDLHYQFDPTYTDRCHPNHPECITGVTCGDCNAGFNPHYHVRGNLISYSNQPIGMGAPNSTEIVEQGISAMIMPNPATEYVELQWTDAELTQVNLLSAEGKMVLNEDVSNKKESIIFDVRDLKAGLYFVEMRTKNGERLTKQLSILH